MSRIQYINGEPSIEALACRLNVDKEELVDMLEQCKSMEEAGRILRPKRVRYITYKGKRQSLVDWARELHIPYYCLRSRLNTLKWSVEKAFSTPFIGYKGSEDDIR